MEFSNQKQKPNQKKGFFQKVKDVLTIREGGKSVILPEKYPGLYNADGTVDLESEDAQDLLSDYEKPEAFNKIGYSRSLGGFFYQFFFALIGAGFLAATYVPFLTYFYPWPESKSMADISGVLFV